MCCVFLLWPVLTTRIISVRSKNHLILKLDHVGPDWAYPCHRSTRTTEYNRYHRVSPGQSWSVPSWHWGRWELGSPGHRTEMDYEWSGFGFAIAPCSSFVGPCWFNLLIYAGPFWTEDLEDTKESTIYDKLWLSSCCQAAHYLECEEILLDRVVEAAQGMASEISYTRLSGFGFALVGSSLVQFPS